MNQRHPSLRALAIVFLASLAFFISIPPILLKNTRIADFFLILGRTNARLHMTILNGVGVESFATRNLLTLSSGKAVEYSPYCFGFLTIGAFALLTLAVPNLRPLDRLKWLFSAALALFGLNQGRIITELMLAYHTSLAVSTIDGLFYPLLPIAALYIWHRGLRKREYVFSAGGGTYA